jgi:dTDP-4-amino-4,6-dideoxygalactose transaminase
MFLNEAVTLTIEFAEGDLEGVDEFYTKQVSIPVGWWLKEEEIEYIVKVIKNY